jgi:xylan 1,4-beta-xylosidase
MAFAELWKDQVQGTVRHCVERYGMDVVRQWYFEVWNEPNLKDNFFEGTYEDFLTLWQFTGTPKERFQR